MKHDDGVDLLVTLEDDSESVHTRLFVVQVKGVLTSDREQWTASVKQLFPAGNYYLPACVFVVNVRDNTAAYAWLAEPKVEHQAARLAFHAHPAFQTLDTEVVDQILNQIRAWYDVIPRETGAKSPS
jgi:hypothetical protein